MLDAIAFALLLRHISKKHKHLKELIYREEHERYMDNKREMSVQLNLEAGERKATIRRTINLQGKAEYFINGLPMLMEDYIQKVTGEYNLNLNNFCVYQGKLEELFFSPTSQQPEHGENKLV